MVFCADRQYTDGRLAQSSGDMTKPSSDTEVLVAGGGIGGLAAALALARNGFAVKVLEQAHELGEIGAGIQLGPNAFAAFDALGVGPSARACAVYADELVMHDATDERVIGRLAVGDVFRERFGNPYAVIHRVDIHRALLEGARANGRIELLDLRHVSNTSDQDATGVSVVDAAGRTHRGVGLDRRGRHQIGCPIAIRW